MSIVNAPTVVEAVPPCSMEPSHKQRPLSVLFWGTESVFSQTVLQRLAATTEIKAVVVPANKRQGTPIEQLEPQSRNHFNRNCANHVHVTPNRAPSTEVSIIDLAGQQKLSIYGIHTLRHPDVGRFLADYTPDIVCVACFPWRIPENLLRIPTFGFINLHPSLLPKYRGPAPLFWQLRAGLTQSGITLHRMERTFDSGDIIAQKEVSLTDGADGPTLDHNYAKAGAAILCEFLAKLAADRQFESTPQPCGGSAHPWPQSADFIVERTWSARHAYNFIRGTGEWQQAFRIDIAGATYTLTNVTGYDAEKELSHTVIESDRGIAIQFSPGVLYARTDRTQQFPIEIIMP